MNPLTTPVKITQITPVTNAKTPGLYLVPKQEKVKKNENLQLG